MRVRTMVGAAVLAAVFAAGCGDDGGSAESSSGGASGGGSATSWCVQGETIGDSFDALDLDPSATANDTKAVFTKATNDLKKLADSAPSEIKADVKVFADALGEMNKTLAKYDYDFIKLAADPKAVESLEGFGDKKLEDASARVEAWIQKNCPNATK